MEIFLKLLIQYEHLGTFCVKKSICKKRERKIGKIKNRMEKRNRRIEFK